MRVVVKNPLRRRAARSTLVKLSAPKGGGIGRMFVSRVAFLASISKTSRQCASLCVGFVLILLILFRLGFTHTRLNGLRAVNSSLPAVFLSVASVSLSFFSYLYLFRLSRVSRWACLARRGMFVFLFWFICPVSVAGLAGATGDVFLFLVLFILSSPLPLGR